MIAPFPDPGRFVVQPQTPGPPTPQVSAPTPYSPQREALFQGLLQGGMQPSGPMGSHWEGIGKLAQVLAGAWGAHRQGKAREREESAGRERLAQAMGGIGQQLGLGGMDLGALAAHPLGGQLLGEALQRTRPAPASQPEADPLDKPYGSPLTWLNQGGEQRAITTPREAREAAAAGFGPQPDEPPQPRIVKGADGFNYFASGPQAGQRVLPDVEKPPEAAAGPDYISPTNVTLPDGSVQTVQTRADLAQAIGQGATLPQGSTRQRPMTEKQAQASLAVARMEPAMQQLFAAGEGGSLYDRLSSQGGRALAGLPGIGNIAAGAGAPEYQQAQALIREIVGAGLRYETGAAITQSEIDDAAARYAPRPGDTPETVATKRRGLETFLEAIRSTLPQAGDGSGPVGAGGGLGAMSDADLLAALGAL